MTEPWMLYVLFGLFQVLDVWTTVQALKLGGVEGNPVIRWFMDRFGYGWIVIKLVGAAGVAALAYFTGNHWAVFILVVIYALVISNNLKVLKDKL